MRLNQKLILYALVMSGINKHETSHLAKVTLRIFLVDLLSSKLKRYLLDDVLQVAASSLADKVT